MSRRFEGKVVVITGASAGIGAAAARQFAGEGAAVALAARSAAPLADLASELERSGARAFAVPTDIAHPQAASRLLSAVADRFGGIDVLVNNAGANKRGPIERYTPEELASVVQVNLTAPIMLTRLVLPYLRTRGRGAIVNVASIAGRIPLGDEAVYSATKFGLRAFTFAMQEELHGSGITMSAVSPGPVDTGFIMDNLDDVPDVVFAQPMSTAEEVARLILRLRRRRHRRAGDPAADRLSRDRRLPLPRAPQLHAAAHGAPWERSEGRVREAQRRLRLSDRRIFATQLVTPVRLRYPNAHAGVIQR